MVNPLLDSLPPIPGNTQGLRSQARLEETLQPRYEPTAPSDNPVVPYYTGLILLSILTFLFLLFLLFKKQIKEVRFAVFATVLMGIGLPILAIVQLTTDLVLREDQSPPPPQASTDSPQQPTEDGEDEPVVTDPEEQPDVVEIPLDFPPTSASGAEESDAMAATPEGQEQATEGLTLSMTGPAAPPRRQGRAAEATPRPQGQAAAIPEASATTPSRPSTPTTPAAPT